MQVSHHADNSTSFNFTKVERAQLFRALKAALDCPDDREFVTRILAALEKAPRTPED